MNPPEKAALAHYFSRFHGKMGKKQVLAHLQSLPRWWTLRDSHGRTAIMRAMNAAGFDADMLSKLLSEQPLIEKTLAWVDHGGKNLWWHLLRQQAYRHEDGAWVPLLRERVPLQAAGKRQRGLFVSLILESPTRQWGNFFPRHAFARLIYQLPNNTHATWWASDDIDGQAAAKWLLGVREHYRENMHSLAQNLERCAQFDPAGRAALALPIRGSLMLLEALYGTNPARVEAEMEAGACVALSTKMQARLRKEAQNSPRFLRDRFEAAMQHNELAALRAYTPPVLATRTRRL